MTSTIEWHKTSERLPEKGGEYLVCHIRHQWLDLYEYSLDEGKWYDNECLCRIDNKFYPEMWAELPWPKEE